MAGITKMVDEQIRVIRKERAELEALKEEMDRRAFANANPKDQAELQTLQEKLASLRKETETANDELNRLKEERNQSISTFKAEIDEIHMEKTLENEAAINQLQLDIDYLKSTKEDMERQKERMFQELTDLQAEKETAISQMKSDENDYLIRQKAERDKELQKIVLDHSLQISKLNEQKDTLQAEIDGLAQKKQLEWDKTYAEIARYKARQQTELSTEKEKILAAAEVEGQAIIKDYNETKKKRAEELAEQEKTERRNLINLELRKKAISDDIELLQFEYEKQKAENLVKIEKIKAEETKLIETNRKEILQQAEIDKMAILDSAEKLRIDIRLKMQEEQLAQEKKVSELEQERQTIASQIQSLKIQADRAKLESEQELERLRSENIVNIEKQAIDAMDEIAKMKISRLKEMEQSLNEYKEEREFQIMQDVAKLENIKQQQLFIIEDKLKLFEQVEKNLSELTKRVTLLEIKMKTK